MSVLGYVFMLVFLVSGCQASDKVQEGVKDSVPGENRVSAERHDCRRVFLVHGGRF